MNPIKKQLMEIARHLPDDATFDEVVEELRFKTKVIEGTRQLDNGEGVPHEEIKKMVKTWFSR